MCRTHTGVYTIMSVNPACNHSLVKQGDTVSSRDWTARRHCTDRTSGREGNPWRTFEHAHSSLSVVWSTEHPGRTKEPPCVLSGSLTGIGLAREVQASLQLGDDLRSELRTLLRPTLDITYKVLCECGILRTQTTQLCRFPCCLPHGVDGFPLIHWCLVGRKKKKSSHPVRNGWTAIRLPRFKATSVFVEKHLNPLHSFQKMVLYNCDILDSDASILRTLCPDELTLRGDTVYSHSLVLLRPLRIA